MSDWSVTYAEAETMLASLHGASGDVQSRAFRGRLKHLKRLGIPIDSSPGRGSKIAYSDDQLHQWAFCLELAEFGIDPTTIASFVLNEWASNLSPHFQEALTSRSDIYFAMRPRLMANAWEPGSFDLQWIDLKRATNFLHRLSGGNRRAILINISDLTKQIDDAGRQYHSARFPEI
jgi:hypothetical protein